MVARATARSAKLIARAGTIELVLSGRSWKVLAARSTGGYWCGTPAAVVSVLRLRQVISPRCAPTPA